MTASPVIPGQYDPKAAMLFGLLARRMIRRRFSGLRLSRGSGERLMQLAQTRDPLLVCMSHAGWWDPLLGIWLHRRYLGGRSGCAPIDRAVLANLRLFRRLGLFGIDPDDPESSDAMVRYVLDRLANEERPTLWITPQGRFQDPRDDMAVRPGAARIAAELPGSRAIVVAAEYPFWDDKKPEMLVHVRLVETPSDPGSFLSWHRAIRDTMRTASAELSSLAVARDASAFETLLGGRGGGTVLIYDLYLRLTGRSSRDIRTRAHGARP